MFSVIDFFVTNIIASHVIIYRDIEQNEETENIAHSLDTVEESYAHDEIDVESFENDGSAKSCFFCMKINIKRKGRQIYCRNIKNKIPFLQKIKSYATELNDIEMLQKIEEESNSVNQSSLAYHNNCNVNYFAKHQRKVNPPSTDDWSKKRDSHKIAKQRLILYIEKEIIANRRVLSLIHLQDCYTEFLKETYENTDLEASIFSTHVLKDFILKTLQNKITVIKISNKQFCISSEVDIEAIDDEEIQDIIFEQEAQDFALKYRKNIMKIKKNL